MKHSKKATQTVKQNKDQQFEFPAAKREMPNFADKIKHRFLSETDKVTLAIITPAEAEHYLSLNNRNRDRKQRFVDRYTDLIKNGQFVLSNDAIVFQRTNGILLNGQHRLEACVLTEKPIHVIVYYGASPNVIEVMDKGNKRTMSDILKIFLDVDVSTAMSPVVRNYYCYINRNEKGAWANSNDPYDHLEEVREIIEKYNQELHEICVLTKSSNPNNKTSRAGVKLALFLYLLQDKKKAEQFIQELSTGTSKNWGLDYPVKRLYDNLSRKNSGGGTIMREDFAITCFAIQNFHRNKEIGRLMRIEEFSL